MTGTGERGLLLAGVYFLTVEEQGAPPASAGRELERKTHHHVGVRHCEAVPVAAEAGTGTVWRERLRYALGEPRITAGSLLARVVRELRGHGLSVLSEGDLGDRRLAVGEVVVWVEPCRWKWCTRNRKVWEPKESNEDIALRSGRLDAWVGSLSLTDLHEEIGRLRGSLATGRGTTSPLDGLITAGYLRALQEELRRRLLKEG